MLAGLLNEVIKVENPIVVENEYGANHIEWNTFIERTKAEVTYNNGNRLNQNNEIVFSYQVIFTVRVYHQITENMRIVWKNKKYRILSIEESKKKQKLVIKTELINE